MAITDSMDTNLSKLWETVKDREPWRPEVHGVTKSLMRFSNGTLTHTHTHTQSVCSQEAERGFHSLSFSAMRAQDLDLDTHMHARAHTHSVCSQEAEHGFRSVSFSVVRAQDPDLSEPRFTVCKARVTVPISRSCCEAFPKATLTEPGPPVAQNGSPRKDYAFRLSVDWDWSARTQDGGRLSEVASPGQ